MKGSFGELVEEPVVLVFFDDTPQLRTNTDDEFHTIIRSYAGYLGDLAKVIKMSMFKNPELCNALRIYHNPTIAVWVNGEEKYRTEEVLLPEEITDIVITYTK